MEPLRDRRTQEHETPRVLVVEDDVDVSDLIRVIVDCLKCDIRSAFSGGEALRVLREAKASGNEIDLVLLDIMMPGIDGYEVISRVKSDPDLCHTSFIVITALSSANDKALGLEMGADDYLTKPFHARELMARIDAVMRVRRSEQAIRRRNQELAALIEINRLVTSSLDLQEVLEATVQGIRRLLEVEAGAVVLADEETAELTRRREFPADEQGAGGGCLDVYHELVTQVIDEGEVATAPGPLLNPDSANGATTDVAASEPHPVLCVPLRIGERTIGAVLLISGPEQGFEEQEVDLAIALATTVAVAVDNAGLYAELTEFTDQLERSQARLVQAEKMAAIGRLAASLAHEINNPLQGIHNSLHLTRQEALAQEARDRYLRMAQIEVERLVEIVQRMLDFYRPSRGGPEPTDINQIVDRVLALAHKRLQHSHVEIDIHLAEDLPRVSLVSDQISQVVLNLLINAIEAMDEGGVLGLETRPSEDGRYVVLSVHDSGRGMSEAQIKNLFEPFYTTKPNGTGLGLAISYGIVERHGGSINVLSKPGEGTTFVVTLPVYRREGVPHR